MSEILDLVEKLKRDITGRMKELEPALREYEQLVETMKMLDYVTKQRDDFMEKIRELQRAKQATWPDVHNWAAMLEPTTTVKPQDVAVQFDKSPSWGSYACARLVEEGIFEKWGRGLYRRRPLRQGTAHLRVVTK